MYFDFATEYSNVVPHISFTTILKAF